MHLPIALFTLASLLIMPIAGRAVIGPSAVPASADCGSPTIVFDHVPPYNSFDNLTGHVTCAAPASYSVAVYIRGSFGWWTKPTFAQPLTPIQSDGTWVADITTGGSDELATDIAAFLVPDGYTPPAMSGGSSLPPELYAHAVATTSVTRSTARTIRFSGRTWEVRNSPAPSGPGPNYFSDDPANVWVDENGSLHLKITQRDGKWFCSEVNNLDAAQYGGHTLRTGSQVDDLDKNAVLGYFTWDNNAPQYHYREIDFEFSRWGVVGDPNAQYVIQPWDVPGNRYRFYFLPTGADTIHRFDWLADHVTFYSWDSDGALLKTWTYTDAPSIPPAGGAIHLNLWLMDGLPPSDGKDVEVIIKSYRFTPANQLFSHNLPLVTRAVGY